MTEVLGSSVRFQQISFAPYKERFVQFGMSDAMAQGQTDMAEARAAGLDNAMVRTPENSTPTTFRQWCAEELKPVVLARPDGRVWLRRRRRAAADNAPSSTTATNARNSRISTGPSHHATGHACAGQQPTLYRVTPLPFAVAGGAAQPRSCSSARPQKGTTPWNSRTRPP